MARVVRVARVARPVAVLGRSNAEWIKEREREGVVFIDARWCEGPRSEAAPVLFPRSSGESIVSVILM